MKAITKNLGRYAMVFIIGAIVFRVGLSKVLENQQYAFAWVLAFVYFLFNFAIGWVFGKRDRETIPLFDVGFRFHLVTYLAFNSVSLLWFLLGQQSKHENIRVVYLTLLIWGIFLIMHFIFYLLAQKHSIKGMNKDEIFE